MTRGESALHTRSTGHPEERPARALTDNAIYLHAAHGKEDKGKTRNSASTDLHSAQAAGACSLWTGLTPGGNASRGQEESAPERLCHTNVTHDLLSLTSWTQQRTISANRNERKVCTHAGGTQTSAAGAPASEAILTCHWHRRGSSSSAARLPFPACPRLCSSLSLPTAGLPDRAQTFMFNFLWIP